MRSPPSSTRRRSPRRAHASRRGHRRIARARAASPSALNSGAKLEPLFGLRLRTERLELRLPTDDELVGLARLAEQGIHEPEEMPFRVAWTDGIGSPTFFRDFAAFHRQAREEWRPEHWRLLLGVWAGTEAIGT